jgi:hypothetical protein
VQHFYDGQIRRYLIQVIRLMSNFTWKDSSGNTRRIPVTYGDLSRQVAMIIANNSENVMPSVPRMAVYITGLEMDRTRTGDSSLVSKVHIRERAFDVNGQEYLNTQGKNYTVERLMPSPYNMTLNCDIWTSNTDQKLQILEQIMMLFNPSLEIQTTDNFVDWTSLSVVNLDRIDFTNRSIPAGTDTEIDIATLGFSTPIWISPPAKVKRLGVITSIITTIFDEAAGNIQLGESALQNALYSEPGLGLSVERSVTNNNDGTADLDVNKRVTSNIGLEDSTAFATTWKNLGLVVLGNTAKLVENGKTGTVVWKQIFDLYPGCYKPGITQLKLYLENGSVVIGYASINSANPYELALSWDTDTIPSNTVIEGPARDPNSKTTVDAIIDPLRYNPTQTKLPGTRLLILGDIGGDSVSGPSAWKNSNSSDFIASENDIIEWDGSQWHIIFNASESTEPVFVTNLTTNSQYKWTGEFWTKSFEGEYSAGTWTIIPEG